jgi:aromatic ring hydroxylase
VIQRSLPPVGSECPRGPGVCRPGAYGKVSGHEQRKRLRRWSEGRTSTESGSKDVTVHPAFAEPIRRIARTYDRAHAAAADPALTFAEPGTGRRHSNMWLAPRSAEDLGARRRVHRFWAEPSYGLMGRCLGEY